MSSSIGESDAVEAWTLIITRQPKRERDETTSRASVYERHVSEQGGTESLNDMQVFERRKGRRKLSQKL